MDHKVFPIGEHKVLNEAEGIVEHFVAITGNRDLGNDRIISGAFRKTIVERGLKVRVLDQHRTDSIQAVIGKPINIREVGRDELPQRVLQEYPDATGGLKVTTQYLMDTPEGKGAFIRIKSGAVDEYSIGYDAIKGGVTFVKSTDGTTERHLKEIKLYEYSPVLFAMNPAATTLSAKTSDVEPSEAKPWRAVRDGDVWKVYKLDAEGEPTGEALGEHESEEQAQAQVRALYASEADGKKDEQPAPEVKVGRMISRANMAKLKAAMEVIEELMKMGGYMDEDEEEMMDKSAPAGVPQAAVIEQDTAQAGPDGDDHPVPPTSTDRLLKLIEIEQAQLENLEVSL